LGIQVLQASAMSRQSKLHSPRLSHFEIDDDNGEDQRHQVDSRASAAVQLPLHISTQYRSTESSSGLEGATQQRVEVTHHPRLDHEQRAQRRCYLTAFLTACLVVVAGTFIANLSSGLAPALSKQQQEAFGGLQDEQTMDVDGADISIGEMEGGGMDVAYASSESQSVKKPPSQSEEDFILVPDAEGVVDLSAYNCVDDRLPNNSPLERGSFLCSHKHGFVVGIFDQDAQDKSFGDLIWRQVPTGETHTFHRGEEHDTEGADILDSFVLSIEGVFQLLNEEGDVAWESSPHPDRVHLGSVTYNDKCLPEFDCPYLHLHSDGVMVLNWIEDHLNPIDGEIDHAWNEKNILELYNFPEFVGEP
jgi:hypothetical protein